MPKPQVTRIPTRIPPGTFFVIITAVSRIPISASKAPIPVDLKVLLPMQRHNACLPNVGWREATGMLFENNAKICARYFKKPLGVLKPGAAADVIIMDYKPFTPFSHENVDGHMLFGMEGKNCRTTIINGKVLYKDREFVGIDEDKINAFCMEQSKKLWGELNHRTY